MLAFALALVALVFGSWRLLRLGVFAQLDPAERLAVAVLIVLAALGWLPLVVSSFGLGVAASLILTPTIVILAVAWFARGGQSTVEVPRDKRLWAIAGVFGLVPLVKALSPSDMLDWDTLAYHFAVPKLWLQADRFEHIPFIHQSNFPFLVDNLFLYGLSGNLEFGAKAVTVLFWLLGVVWIFGVVNRRFSSDAALWSCLAFAGAPVVLWSSGSGYIDVAHGLYAAIGAFYAFESLEAAELDWMRAGLAGLGLGAAMGSKYTGLQVAFLSLLVVLSVLAFRKRWSPHGKLLAAAGGIALLIACPWYVRNIANTGNPVFPFFYERLGGKGWDQWRADIYRNEQQTFGVGRTEKGRDPMALGHSVLGLGYQPGRFINPGQTEGQGVPMGATGVVLLLVPFAWLAWGRRKSPWTPLVALTGLSFLLFFLLSQQVRYLASLWPLWSILVGATLSQFPQLPKSALAVIGAQAAYTWGLLYTTQTQAQLPVALGAQNRQAFQESVVAFSQFAPQIDATVGKGGKVALFHEVFGYFLNVPYMWGNPGHSDLIPYERLQTGDEWVEAMRAAGVTHVYLRLGPISPREREWLAAALSGSKVPTEQAAEADQDLNLKWMRLLCDAIASGRAPVETWFTSKGSRNPSAIMLSLPPNG